MGGVKLTPPPAGIGLMKKDQTTDIIGTASLCHKIKFLNSCLCNLLLVKYPIFIQGKETDYSTIM